jgi:nitric oxide reductase NorQ protein
MPTAPTAIEPYTLPADKKLTTSSQWYDVLAQLTRTLDRILLVGPPSSGKSTTAIKTLGIKHRITMTPNTSREDLCGMFHLIDGQTVWIDGPVTKAMRNGHPVLIDEIDRAGAEVESLMYSVIDDQPHLSLPNGELVQAASGYKVLMTSNQSPDVLEDAVRDRMEAILLAYSPHKDALVGLSDVESTLVLNYYKTITKPTLRLNPTVRRMRAFRKICNAGIPAQIAAVSVFGPNASMEIASVVANIEAAEVK